MAALPEAWLERELTLAKRAPVAVELRDGADVVARVAVERGHPRTCFPELAATLAENERELRSVVLVVVDADDHVMARRVVRTSGANASAREERSPQGMLAQVMRHSEAMAGENRRLLAECGKQSQAVFDALVSENRRLSEQAARDAETRLRAARLVEELQDMAAERELTARIATTDIERKDAGFRELKQVFGQVRGFLEGKTETGLRSKLRAFAAGLATKAPEELDAMLSKLTEAERRTFEKLVGTPEEVAAEMVAAEQKAQAERDAKALPGGNGHG